jgi:hypothetical protein
MEPKELLNRVADDIDEKGLWQYNSDPGDCSGTCVLISAGELGGESSTEAIEVLAEFLGIDLLHVALWNDTAPNKEFVVTTLREAAL